MLVSVFDLFDDQVRNIDCFDYHVHYLFELVEVRIVVNIVESVHLIQIAEI